MTRMGRSPSSAGVGDELRRAVAAAKDSEDQLEELVEAELVVEEAELVVEELELVGDQLVMELNLVGVVRL